jgi:hypothetical protein
MSKKNCKVLCPTTLQSSWSGAAGELKFSAIGGTMNPVEAEFSRALRVLAMRHSVVR